MAGNIFGLSPETLDTVDLGLSAVPDDAIDNHSEYAHGVIDGIKLAYKTFNDPDFTPSEVIDSMPADIVPTLMDRSRVLGLLAGSLAATRLIRISIMDEFKEKS